ncbi:uncharacterized protein HaLaN_16561, partial [Haematococcus lacustris]
MATASCELSAQAPSRPQSWFQRIFTALRNAWNCFDRVVGRAIGLDVPKYAWAIAEHQRLLREEEDAVLNGSAQVTKTLPSNATATSRNIDPLIVCVACHANVASQSPVLLTTLPLGAHSGMTSNPASVASSSLSLH